ncbi:MAG: response regulator [Methanomassiliicoccales archaeon]
MTAKILVVDDELGIRNVITSLLKEKGYQISTAGTGAEALRLLSNEFFNVVILDIILPDMTGTQLLEKIERSSPDSEVILITGHASLDTAIQALRKRSFDYIQKPFKLGQLLETIEGALEHQRLTLENRKMLEQLKFLNNINSQIMKTLELDSILKHILYLSMNFFRADSGAIYLRNGTEWKLRQYSGVTKRFVNEFGSLSPEHPIIRDAMSGKVSVTQGNNGYAGSSWASIPLLYLEQPLGVMILTAKTGKRFDEEDRRLLSILGIQTGSYIYNSLLFSQAEETRSYLEGFVRNSAEAIITYSLDGKIRTWNDAARRTYGYSESEAIGRYLIIVPENRLEEMREIMTKVGNGEVVDYHETIRRRKDGTLIPVLATYSPVRDSTGKVIGISSISRDMSLLRRIEEEQVRGQISGAKVKVREVLIDMVPLLMKLPFPEEERKYIVSKISQRLEESLYDEYFAGKESVDLQIMGEGVARVLNDLGGDFSYQLEGDEVIIQGRKCPWNNQFKRNPIACSLTKAIALRFANRSWGAARVQLTQSLANKDDCCKLTIRRIL